MADLNATAQKLVNEYYTTFDADRSKLRSFYRDSSTLTVNGTPYQGVDAIATKLSQLRFPSADQPFKTSKHTISTVAVQRSSPTEESRIALVTGTLETENSETLHFVQTLHLVPDAQGHYVFNHIFQHISS